MENLAQDIFNLGRSINRAKAEEIKINRLLEDMLYTIATVAPNPKADRDCPKCKGYGIYWASRDGETVKKLCSCTQTKG